MPTQIVAIVRAVMAVTAVGSLAAACSSGGSSPFGSASSVELTFVGAAQTWDINKDNVVTCAEWKSYTADLFQSSDKNGDGSIGADEYPNITKQDKLFESVGMGYFDSNGDGKLTLAEFSERENPAFRVLDKNKDCTLASDEIVQTRAPPAAAKSTYGEAPDIPKR